jgi:DNA repair exonuclease SbcCD nuclease subunit
VATDALRAVLRGLGDEMDVAGVDGRGPRVFLGHVMARGSRTSTGQEMLGMPLELGLEDLALVRADAYLLGHIHLGAGNEWQIGDSPALYGGSPRRCTFGEPEVKSYTVLEFEDGPEGRLVSWERVPTPCVAMVHLEEEWDAEAGRFPWIEEAEFPPGAELRLRYRVAADQRDAARRSAQEVADRYRERGAVSVKLEEQVIASTRARTPEVAAAKTLADKIAALWEARKDVPDPVRREAIVSKLGELEGAA